MSRPSRLENILNKRKDFYNDSESDISSLSDQENINILSDTSTDENNKVMKKTCCLICSVLPNLSNINTCEKHLKLLTKPKTSRKIVYMVSPPKLHCHCRVKSKRRYRSSSSSSSKSQHYQKKRTMTVQSSNSSSQSDLYMSPSVLSQGIINDNQQHVQPLLSPSLPPSSTNINHNLQQYNELLFAPLLNNQQTNSSDVIEIDCDSPHSSPSKQIVHVKDDNEICNDNDPNKLIISMAQATEQMLNNQFPQPIILLKRVCFER